MTAQLLGLLAGSFAQQAPARPAAGLPCQPLRLKLQALLASCGRRRCLAAQKKSPRQGARAGVTMLITK
jgi:hypothetical protein